MSHWHPKNSRYERKRKQPRGISGKFSHYGQYTWRDVLNQSVMTAEGHRLLNADLPNHFGVVKNGTWWLAVGESTVDKRGMRRPKYLRAVEVLWKASMNRNLQDKEWLKKCCKCKGCINIEHYEIKRRVPLISQDQTRIVFEQAIKNGEARLQLKDKITAMKNRLQMYKHKKKFEGDGRLWPAINDFELVVEDTLLICRKKGDDPEVLAALARSGFPLISEAKQQNELLERVKQERSIEEIKPTAVLDENEGIDPVLAVYGFSSKQEKNEAVADCPDCPDCPYDLDNPPLAGDADYERFVTWAQNPENKKIIKQWKKGEKNDDE